MKRGLVSILLTVAMTLTAVADEVAPKREMRATWISTVWQLDWPSKTGSTPQIAELQRQELRALLDNVEAAGLNAVCFQVRPMADALYKSKYEPWSSFLTGARGKAPAADWDPLQFCVDECHRRGIECHAWVNPFRFSMSDRLPSAASDIAARDKGWVISYYNPKTKRTTSILDPGNSAARKHIVDVCRDIVTSYDVDGLLFDDYFYPEGLPLGGGYDYDEWVRSKTPDQAQWRRDNVNRAIREVAEMIGRERPYVRFGVSPAGVGGGNGKAVAKYGLPGCYAGNDWMYDGIFCDPVAWLADGLVDYVSPQIYWATDHRTNPFEPIARWWSEIASHFGRHCFASHSISDLKANPTGSPSLLDDKLQQMRIDRNCAPNDAPGAILYPASPLKTSREFTEWVASNHFVCPSLLPAMYWKDAPDPGEIKGLTLAQNGVLSWQPMDNMRYIVYAIPLDCDLESIESDDGGYDARYMVGVCYESHMQIPSRYTSGHWLVVAPLDRYGNEWDPMFLWQ